MNRLLQVATLPLMILSTCAFIMSVVVHLCAMALRIDLLGGRAVIVFMVIFLMAMPAILIAQYRADGVRRKDFWRVALQGCPPWMNRTAKGLGIYALVVFGVFFLLHRPGTPKVPGTDPDSVWFMSAYAMAFSFSSYAICHSARHTMGGQFERRCPNGHEVGAVSRFCPECGSPLQ